MDINQKYLVNPADVKNVIGRDGNRIGVEIEMHIPYYRGIALSLLDDLYVKFNDTVFEKEKLVLTIDGLSYTWPQIETVSTMRWEYGTKAKVFVPADNGFEPTRTVRVELGCAIRISYASRFAQPCVVYFTVDPCNMTTVQY